jgi:negative regulator of sigma E activity
MNDDREIERESQLSAMFDGELSAGECELIARRLSRDEALRSQWSRYSMIGATIRAERGVALHDRVAWRVQSIVAQEPVYGDGTDIGATNARTAAVVPAEVLRRAASRRWTRWANPLAGAGIAASVAAAAILFLRVQGGTDEWVADTAGPSESIVLTPDVAPAPPVRPEQQPVRVADNRNDGEPDVYVVPPLNSSNGIAPNASLANYVVAHSEVSGPISRRMALLGILASEQPGAVAAQSENIQAEADASTEANDAP